MHYWLRLLDSSGSELEPPTAWVADSLDDPMIPDKCCAIFRHGRVDRIEVYTAQPAPDIQPAQIHRRTPCPLSTH